MSTIHSSCSLIGAFEEKEPREDQAYFPFLQAKSSSSACRIISVCIPCYNEDACSLKRTMNSLQNQKLPKNIKLEVFLAMDGTSQIHQSMRAYLGELFGISLTEGHNENPFVSFPHANTIVVESESQEVDFAKLHCTLLIKRVNERKVNSHLWWLRGHAEASQCEFALATDCGIIFGENSLRLMVERFDSQPNASGLTGFQRVMTSEMQGDGTHEIFADPFSWFLRTLQNFDVEFSQVGMRSVQDAIGFLPVLPGPCSMFRFQKFRQVMGDYFDLTTKELHDRGDSLVLGNVQLAEDRFPPVLLTFQKQQENQAKCTSHQATGFVHDADFYFEAEKPLHFLMKQRRRWINGSYAACYWVLRANWISDSQQSWVIKNIVRALLCMEFVQGAMLRILGPAIAACGVAFMCVVTPYLLRNDIGFIQKILSNTQTPDLFFALCTAGVYMAFYAIFMVRHTPRAVPVKACTEACTEQPVKKWRSDHRSAYRPRLFVLSLIINVIISIWFTVVGVALCVTLGWKNMPMYFQAITIAFGMPYLIAFMDGLVNSERPNIMGFCRLLMASPVFLLSSIWFYIWIPSYATARVSDLSWGNRSGTREEVAESDVAQRRATIGKWVSYSLVLFNVTVVALAIGVKNVAKSVINYVLFPLMALQIFLSLLNLGVIMYRLLARLCNLVLTHAKTTTDGTKPFSKQDSLEEASSRESVDTLDIDIESL